MSSCSMGWKMSPCRCMLSALYDMEWKSLWVVGTHSWMIATWVFLNMCLLICVVACGVFFVDRGLPGFHPLTLRL